MSNICLGVKRTCSQNCCCGKVKVEENIKRNEVSGMQFCPKLQDATSAMEFSTPTMEETVSGPAYDARWTSLSPLSWRPDVWYCDLSAMHANHATVGVLSDSTLDPAILISTYLCTINYCRITTDISKSELIRRPCGLCSETSSLSMALSNYTVQMKGFNCLVRLNHTPPATAIQASQQP